MKDYLIRLGIVFAVEAVVIGLGMLLGASFGLPIVIAGAAAGTVVAIGWRRLYGRVGSGPRHAREGA